MPDLRPPFIDTFDGPQSCYIAGLVTDGQMNALPPRYECAISTAVYPSTAVVLLAHVFTKPGGARKRTKTRALAAAVTVYIQQHQIDN